MAAQRRQSEGTLARFWSRIRFMNKLTEQHFSFKCPMDFGQMEISGNGRHCSQCQKQVFDLTHCSIDDVIDLQRKHGPICGSIKVAQVAAVALSLSAAACRTTGSETASRITGTPQMPKHTEVPCEPTSNLVVGKIKPMEDADKTKR